MTQAQLMYLNEVLGIKEVLFTKKPAIPFAFVSLEPLSDEGKKLIDRLSQALNLKNFETFEGPLPEKVFDKVLYFGGQIDSKLQHVLYAPPMSQLLGNDETTLKRKKLLWTEIQAWLS